MLYARLTNEKFLKIDKELLGYEILEGTQYKVYQKALKAFKRLGGAARFHSIEFHDNICTLRARKWFSDTPFAKISFPYSSKTTIKQIAENLERVL